MNSSAQIDKVRAIVSELGFNVLSVDLGKIEITEKPDAVRLAELKNLLCEAGMDILSEKKVELAERIKEELKTLIDKKQTFPDKKLSEYITERIGLDYYYLSHTFSDVMNVSIEKYFILLKIERIKEMLVNGANNISEIADKLSYSSVQALSGQFKKVTGITPSEFKKGFSRTKSVA